MAETNLVRFRAAVEGALRHLEARRQEVNDLNVFPVADGDTGDNMALTLRAVLEELDRIGTQQPVDAVGRQEIVDSVARAALLGARGNSGVILSQFIRGAAEELAGRRGDLVDPVLVGAALARAADRAYDSVREPAEGTMLTVVREMAHAVARELARMPEAQLRGEVDPAVQDSLIAHVLDVAVEAGQASVRRGPELLPVLRDAGVVDAGGYAVVLLIAGVVAALRGDEAPEVEHHAAAARPSHPEHSSSTFRYCTNFVVTGSGLDAGRSARALEELGDSVLVVGDAATLKVHVHTDDPGAATGLFADAGEVSHLDVADMREQISERSERLAGSANGNGAGRARPATCGALAVVAGDGMRRLYEGLGVHALDGGPTLNPSTYDLLAGIHDVGAEQVVVLPNSPNVIMAAERAAELSEKRVVVVPSRSQQGGLAAAVAFEPTRDVEANAADMGEALARVRTGAVAQAARDDGQGRFRQGQAVGFVGEEIVAWGEPAPTLEAVLAALGNGGAELLTCIAGDGAPLTAEQVEGLAPAGVELECSEGGQPAYWWLVSAE